MSTTITIRTDDPLRQRLEKRAAAEGKSLSATVREILENAVAERSVGRRAGHLKARLSLPRGATDLWRKSVRARNWRP
jgi:plasmid stability protein